MKFAKLIFLVVCFSSYSCAQNSDIQAATYNVVSGALMGGLGAIINKKKEQTVLRAFLRGSSQGAIGGYMVFESKRLVREFSVKNNYSYLWPSKALNEFGNSMVLNGAYNRKIGQSWFFNVGFGHAEIDFKREKKLTVRILPLAFTSVVNGFISGRLDTKKTLKSGNFIFKKNSPIGTGAYAYNFVNTIVLGNEIPEEDMFLVIAHEIIHSYQYSGFSGLNAYTYPLQNRWQRESKSFKWYNKFFYTDFNAIPIFLEYTYTEIFNIPHEDIWAEKEAFYYQSFKN